MIYLVLGLLIALGIFLLYVGFQRAEYEVTREILIAAPASRIFPYVNNSVLMNGWNPWLKLDPDVKIEVSGPAEGVGAKTAWISRKKGGTGVGAATVIESVPYERVRILLEYTEPFIVKQHSLYSLQPQGDFTVVIWSVGGHNNFVSRVICFFMNMDKMVGDTFVKGLMDLKVTLEKAS